MFYKFDFFKVSLFLFSFIFLLLVLFNFLSPNEAFAMEPPKDYITDYYGNNEYVGSDAYGHAHPANVGVIPDRTIENDAITPSGDRYGTQSREYDWYADHDPKVRPHVEVDSSTFVLYVSIKRRAFWYVWKKYSNEYKNYNDFKKSWDSKSSIRKEILKDVKSSFNK